jgi:hypothetical protein
VDIPETTSKPARATCLLQATTLMLTDMTILAVYRPSIVRVAR